MCAVAILLGGPAKAQTIPVDFTGGGATSFDGWNNLTSSRLIGYGGFPGSSAWPGPIVANVTGSGDAGLHRMAGSPTGGGPFPASESLYFGSFLQVPNALGGTLAVVDSSPLGGVKTVVFQIQIGEADGYDFHEPAGLPVLKVNGATVGIAPTFERTLITRFQNGVIENPVTGEDEPVYINTWGYQWNITEPGAVTSFRIEFGAVTHAQIYEMRLDQTNVLQADVFGGSAVPDIFRIVSVGQPEFDGVDTTVTHHFEAPAAASLVIHFTDDLSVTPTLIGPVGTGTGTFPATFTRQGDHRAAWSRMMFFTAAFAPDTP